MPVRRIPISIAVLLSVMAAAPLGAQDSVPPPPAAAAPDTAPRRADSGVAAAPRDTTTPELKRPISPGGALIRSLLIPGWGQAKLGRGLTAGFFLAVEGASLGMALKANSELQHFKATGDPRADDKSQEREDWLVIMGVNHLIAGIEAYVSAYLWDFPGDLRLQATPNGTAATIAIPVRFP